MKMNGARSMKILFASPAPNTQHPVQTMVSVYLHIFGQSQLKVSSRQLQRSSVKCEIMLVVAKSSAETHSC